MLSDDDIKVWNFIAATVNNNRGKIHFNKQSYYLPVVIDLHNYSIQDAYNISFDFIKESYLNKSKIITIITGKGHPECSIKRELPLWFETDKFSKYIKSWRIINDGAFIISLSPC